MLLSKIHALPVKSVFMIDAGGAFLSALILWVLCTLEEYIGMPRLVLLTLSLIAAGYGIFSVCCFFRAKGKGLPLLRILIVANIFYGVLTLVLVLVHYTKLTGWGLGYFICDMVVITGVIVFEIFMVRRLRVAIV